MHSALSSAHSHSPSDFLHMPIQVVSCYTYRTSVDSIWTDAHHSVNQFVDAIKEKAVRGFGHVLVNGQPPKRRISSSNAHKARAWFGEMGSRILMEADLTSPLVLIPVPNSACTLTSAQSRIAKLAHAIQTQCELVQDVADVLRWDQPMPSASQRMGPRDPSDLYPHLELLGTLSQRNGTYVLIDDVLTTGGHIRACSAFLARRGVVATFAVCAARSDPNPQDNPFRDRVDELDDFEPVPDR